MRSHYVRTDVPFEVKLNQKKLGKRVTARDVGVPTAFSSARFDRFWAISKQLIAKFVVCFFTASSVPVQA
jgi:hypothetical protein